MIRQVVTEMNSREFPRWWKGNIQTVVNKDLEQRFGLFDKATGAPVIAIEYDGTRRGNFCEGIVN